MKNCATKAWHGEDGTGLLGWGVHKKYRSRRRLVVRGERVDGIDHARKRHRDGREPSRVEFHLAAVVGVGRRRGQRRKRGGALVPNVGIGRVLAHEQHPVAHGDGGASEPEVHELGVQNGDLGVAAVDEDERRRRGRGRRGRWRRRRWAWWRRRRRGRRGRRRGRRAGWRRGRRTGRRRRGRGRRRRGRRRRGRRRGRRRRRRRRRRGAATAAPTAGAETAALAVVLTPP